MNRSGELLTILLLVVSAASSQLPAAERVVHVGDDVTLRRSLAEAQSGTRIVVAPGKYRPGASAANLRGTAEEPIVIEAADPKDMPVFEGGPLGIHLSGVAHV